MVALEGVGGGVAGDKMGRPLKRAAHSAFRVRCTIKYRICFVFRCTREWGMFWNVPEHATRSLISELFLERKKPVDFKGGGVRGGGRGGKEAQPNLLNSPQLIRLSQNTA